MNGLLVLELFFFGGAALAWGAWELFSVNRAIKKREAQEAAVRSEVRQDG